MVQHGDSKIANIYEVHCKRWLLSKRIAGITLYPLIFYNKQHKRYKNEFKELRAHEWAHIDQVRNIGFLKFYLKYIFSSNFREKVEADAEAKSKLDRGVFK